MSNFKKIFGLAGAVMVFTGLAYGQQLNCNQSAQAPQATAFLIRAEGTAEQVADLVLTCTNTGTAATVAGATLNVQAFLSAPVTSKVLTGSGSTASEALLLVGSALGSTPTSTQMFQGTVSGSSVQFNGVTFPTAIAAAGTVTLTITNIRVNASTVTVGTGAPPPVTESVFVSGAAAVAAATNPIQVAFVTPGLLTAKSFKSFTAGTGLFPANSFTAGTTAGSNNFVVCSAINAAGSTVLNVIQVAEGFATAFKSQGSAASNNTVGSEFTNNTETGFVPAAFPTTAGSNIATSGTRIKVTFTNVPTGLTLYVPTSVGSINSSNGNTAASGSTPAVPAGVSSLVLTSSETGAFSATSAATTSSTIGANLAAITATSGTATAVYEYQGAAGGGSSSVSETFNIPVQAVTTSNGVTASSSAIMESVSFAPTGATSNIPNFVAGANNTTPIAGSTFNTCTTSLLFPFVTNQLGFDTGIAIANTSTDPFGSNGAAPQAGTCTLNFYGAGAPTPSNITSPNIPTGTVFTQVLSNVAAGFQGYLIAQCQFQFAHGFAFITDGVGANGGLAEGYLAGVIPDVNQKKRSADPSGVASAGTGETLGQ